MLSRFSLLSAIVSFSCKRFGLPINHFARNPTILKSRIAIGKAAPLLLA
ncbi:MAG TPA: hypothetical protein VLU23_08770 [Pseudolabrys sp.]|nr:hypothetical protein [Pseudolabrys sp.]